MNFLKRIFMLFIGLPVIYGFRFTKLSVEVIWSFSYLPVAMTIISFIIGYRAPIAVSFGGLIILLMIKIIKKWLIKSTPDWVMTLAFWIYFVTIFSLNLSHWYMFVLAFIVILTLQYFNMLPKNFWGTMFWSTIIGTIALIVHLATLGGYLGLNWLWNSHSWVQTGMSIYGIYAGVVLSFFFVIIVGICIIVWKSEWILTTIIAQEASQYTSDKRNKKK